MTAPTRPDVASDPDLSGDETSNGLVDHLSNQSCAHGHVHADALEDVSADEIASFGAPIMEGIVDFHIHSAPSLMMRHHVDPELIPLAQASGVATMVLKAHEGSSAARAALLDESIVGAIVLNSSVGGANPDAVEVAAQLGARVVWMPTISAQAHRDSEDNDQLAVHRGVNLRVVPVCENGELRDEWHEVLDVIARHDMVLCSGHIALDETVALFTEARRRGVERLIVTHPLLEFLGWRDEHAQQLQALGAHVEIGVLADLLAGTAHELDATTRLHQIYDPSLMVFGSDLGHVSYPDLIPGIGGWIRRASRIMGDQPLEQIMITNGRELLS